MILALLMQQELIILHLQVSPLLPLHKFMVILAEPQETMVETHQ